MKILHDDLRLLIMDHDNKIAWGNGGTLFEPKEIDEIIKYLENTRKYVIEEKIDVKKYNEQAWKESEKQALRIARGNRDGD